MTDFTSPNVGNYTVPKANCYFTPVGGTRRHLGNIPEAALEPEVEKLEHFSAMTGIRTKDFTAIISKSMTISLTLEEFSRQNLQLALMGNDLTAEDTEGNIGFDIGAADSISGRLEIIASNEIGPKWDYDFPSVTFSPEEAIDLISNSDDSVSAIGITADINAVNGSFGRATLQGSSTA